MKYVICLQVLGIFSTNINFAFSDSTTYLTENFFANLQENLKDASNDPSTYQFIDRQVDNYIKLIQSTRGSENVGPRRKRNTLKSLDISRDIHDLYILDKLTPLDIIETTFPQDIMLFKHDFPDCEKWYAIALEKLDLKIYKYNGTHFIKLFTQPAKSGIKLGLHTFSNGTFIVAAENSPIEENFNRKSTVYLFTRSEKLEEIQKVDAEFASDVSIWEDKGRIFMGISKTMSNSTGREEYETESVIYKWLGKHFDIIQSINTSEAMKIIPFVIGKLHFVAVANRQNNFGVSNVYSEILKYDLDSEKFVSYQKILTDGASDIKVFCFKKNNQHEYFLAVANSFSKDVHQNIVYKTNSIIYKFVDDNFIPFQSFNLIGLTEWLPVRGLNGEFALFAACKHEGLKIFQYNGWRFVESETQYTDNSFGKGILSMNSYQFQGDPVVVVANANDNGAMVNFFRIDFRKENQLNEYYDGMLIWCKKSLLDIKNPKEKELVKAIKKTPTVEEKELVLSKKLTFKHLTVVNLRTSEIENSNRKSRSNDPELEDLKTQLKAEKRNLEQLEAELKKITNPKVTIFQNNVLAKNVIFTNDNFFNNIIVKTINGIDMKDYLKNIIYLNINGFSIPHLELESAKFKNNVTVRKINGHNVNSLLHTNIAMELKNLSVEGKAIFDRLNIKGLINGVNVTRESVLLVDEDQTLRGNLDVGKVIAENVAAKFLNKLPLENSAKVHKTTHKIHSLDNLKTKNLIIEGYLNNIDLPTLDKYALRIKGDQEITGPFHFDQLKVNNFNNIQIINGIRVPEELVRIDDGDYEIKQDVQFTSELEGNGIFVSGQLNQIKVKQGKLDVLLKDTDEHQEISGYKDFEHIDVTKPIDMQGNCCGENNKINPVRSINEEINRIGDFVINGNVNIEDILSVRDITTKDEQYSIGRLKKHGLRLNEKSIPIHLNFTQQLNVLEVSLDKINDIDPSDWVLNGVADTQYIKGGKMFEGDLHITGDTNLMLVNSINLPDMKANILNVNGDQIIKGKLHVQQISTESIQGTNIRLSTHNWTDLVSDSNEPTFTGETILKSLSAKSINCTHLNVSGTINAMDFNFMLEDTIFKDSKNIISGHKHFTNLTVDNLTSRKSINLMQIPSMIKKAEVVYNYNGVFPIPENLNIENLYFKNRLNHLNATEFSANWLGGEKEQIINGDQYFEELMLLGDNTVLTNRINNVNLTELNLDTVKIDEPNEFNAVNFENDFISLDTIDLKGHIEGIDVETILADTGSELVLTDTINFLNNVYVSGKVYTPSLVNGLNFTALCDFAEPDYNESPKNLIVNGNACFLKSPVVKKINGLPIAELVDNVWLRNKETTLHGNLYFNKVSFEENVEVKGLLGDVKIDWLKNTYFSKTKNQTVSAKLEFAEGVFFEKNLIAPQGKAGRVSGIRLEDFIRTAVLDDFDQIFEQALYAETVKFNDLQGSFNVNGYNLQNDVMRYDVPNFVTGKKIIHSVKADRLRMDRNYKVQNVDLLDWVQKGVLRNGTRKIDGRISFKGSTIFGNGISLSGLLNKNKFSSNNILLKSTPQIINAKKVFVKSSQSQSLFKNVKLKGYLNYVEVSDLIHNQASKNKENIFTSQVNFNTDLSAQNVIFEGLFQGVNVSQLLYNLTNYVTLNNYYSNYDSLYQVSKKVRDSLTVQAHFLKYYKPLQYFNDVDALFPVKLSFYGDMHLATVHIVDKTHVINFFQWDPETNQFSINPEMLNIIHGYVITRIAPIEFDEETYLYVEHKLTEPVNGNWRIGEIISITNRTSIEVLYEIPNNGTTVILPVILPLIEKVCVLMSFHSEPYMNIYCEEEEDLLLYQKLEIENTVTPITTTIDDAVYIMAISEGRDDEGTSVIIWKSDKNTALFNIHQYIYVANANSIATIEYNGEHYLAISSGQLVNTIHSGQVIIKRFHQASQSFIEYQEIPADAPIQLEFSLLPSNELMLYVLSECPSNPLVIYKYEGLSKFTLKYVASSLEICSSISHFNNYNKNFLVTKSREKFTVIEAIFKGY